MNAIMEKINVAAVIILKTEGNLPKVPLRKEVMALPSWTGYLFGGVSQVVSIARLHHEAYRRENHLYQLADGALSAVAMICKCIPAYYHQLIFLGAISPVNLSMCPQRLHF